MADQALITRRAALVGALSSSLALAVPAAAAVHIAEDPHAKVRRLQRELSAALAGLASYSAACDYVAVTYPDGTADGYGRSLIEREIFESTREAETRRTQVIGRWRAFDGAAASVAYSQPFDRTRWENLNFNAQDALGDMLRTFRASS